MSTFSYIKTPIEHYNNGDRTFVLKMENLQPSGSFKLRGMDRFFRQKVQDGEQRFVCSSGGNAGYSAAYVGQKLGVHVKVVVPVTTSQRAISLIESTGAEVEVFGGEWYEADIRARDIVRTKGYCYVHPFDDPLLWEGHATMVDELVSDVSKPNAVVVSVGGGGLFIGLMQGLIRTKWDNIPIIACETEGAASFQASSAKGSIVALDKITSIAGSLGAKEIATHALSYTKSHHILHHVVSDKAAVEARDWFKATYNHDVEPACGAALSVVQLNKFAAYKSVLVIVCGGIGWDSMMSENFLKS